MIRYNISVVGAGNVASSLCEEMFCRGHRVIRIVSETRKRGIPLAGLCNASWSDELVFSEESDIVIVAVPDNRLKGVLDNISCGKNSVVAHTAGSFGLDIFPSGMSHSGVFYPLQTFTKGRKTDFSCLNILIETSDNYSSSILEKLATSLGSKIRYADTEHRKMLHLAAVFICNFTNHMLTAGKEISTGAGFTFEILEPLIRETYYKAIEQGPEFSQTGPAVRYDINTIEKHLELLSFKPELQKMYKVITESIMNHYKQS